MNKLGTKLGAIAMSAVMALSFAPSAAITSLAAGGDDLTDATQELSTPVYRLYNPNSGEHLFTTNENECDSLDKNGWDYETIAWYAPSTGDPVFRLYNPNHPLGDHHYTSSEEERDNLIKQGWKLDATAFNTVAEGELLGAPVYSLYNPNAYDLGMATHHLTLSEEEADGLELLGWTNEGPKFYEYAEDLDPEVEELTVSIDNTTPKVGDTLTATVDPADADVEFQWYSADDEDGEFTEIEDATAATYVVQAADYGKFIKVVASDTLGNEDSDVTAEAVTVGEGVTITDVEQTGEYTAILTFSGVAPDGTITAIKGESKATVNADYQFSADRTQAEVLFENRLQADTYTITFTPEVGDPSDITTTFEVARLAKIEFPTGVAVAQSLSNIKTLKVAVMGIDQFGSDIAVPSTTEFTFSKGLKIGDANNADATNVSSFKDGVLTVAAAPTGEAGTAYQSGDYYQLGGLMPLVVTAVWTDGEGHAANGSATLEISNNSVVQSIVWGELTTDDDSYVDKPVTRKSLENANYYVPFVAVDQYGLPVTADDMEKGRTNADGKTVFVSPDSSNAGGFTAYAGKFGTLSDDNTTEVVFGVKNVDGEDLDVMYISAGTSPLRAGTVDFNIIPAGGSVQKWSLTVEDDLDIETMDIPKVSLQENEKATLTINAYDQNGDEIDFWTYQPVKTQLGVDADTGLESKGELLWEIEPGAIYNTKITYTGCGIYVKKDAATKTISFEIKPSGKKNSVATVMWSTAGQQTGSWTSTVAAPASVEGINTDNMIKYVIPGEGLSFQTSAIDDSHTPIRFVDSNNGKIDSNKKLIANDDLDGYGFGIGEHIDGKYVAYTWRVTPTSTTAVYGAGTITAETPASLQLAANAKKVSTPAVATRKQTGITSVRVGDQAYTIGDTPSNTGHVVKATQSANTANNTYEIEFEAALSTDALTTVVVTYTYEEETAATWWTNSDMTTPYEWNAFDHVDQEGNLHARETKKNGAEIDSPLSDTFTIHLYKLTAPTGGGKATITEIAKKNITLTVVPEASVDYDLSVGNMLYTADGNSTDGEDASDIDGHKIATVSLSATYKGETVEVGDKTLEESTVSVTEGTIKYSAAAVGIKDDTKTTADDSEAPVPVLYYDNGGDGSDLAAGTATLYGSVVVGTKLQKLSATVYFDKATPVGTTASLDDGTELTGLIDDLDNPTAITRDDGEGDIYILDQYGEYVDGTATIIGYAHHDENGNTIPVDPQDIVAVTANAATHKVTFAASGDVDAAEENDTFTLVYSQGTVSMELPVSLHGPSASATGNNLGVAFNPVVDETRTDLTNGNIDGA